MGNKLDQNNMLLTRPAKSLFFKYLLPSISATLVTSIYILADTIMIGNGVGPEGIAALNIVLPVFSLFFGTGMLFGVGGAVLMSIAAGQDNIEKGQRYFTTSVISAAAISIFYWILFGFFFEPIMYMLGANNSMIGLIRDYGYYIVFGAPFFLFSSLMQAFVRNDKNPKLAMIGVVTGGVLNVILDYLFIFPLKMGMGGAALASVIGTIVTLLIVSTHLFTKRGNLKLIKKGFSLRYAKQIIGNGTSSFFIEVAGGVVIFWFNLQLLRYVGDLGVTAYGIISNSGLVAMSLANGVAQAAQPILATNFGAGKYERVTHLKRLGLITTSVIGIALAVFGLCFPEFLVSIFVAPSTKILELAVPAIRVYFLSFAVMNINIFFSNYFQATMRPVNALGICALRGFLLSTALVFLLPAIFGVMGIWVTMPIVEGVTFLVCLMMEKKTNCIRIEAKR